MSSGITNAMDMNLGKFQEMWRDREDWYAAAHGVAKSPWDHEELDTTRQLNHSSKVEEKDKDGGT